MRSETRLSADSASANTAPALPPIVGEALVARAAAVRDEVAKAFIGQDESAWGSLEQRVPDRGFEGAQSPAHRRLGQRQCPRRRRRSAH